MAKKRLVVSQLLSLCCVLMFSSKVLWFCLLPIAATGDNIQNNNDKNHQPDGIQVIGAGLGRTGTKSLEAALTGLGYKVYHFIDPNHASLWADLARGNVSPDVVIDAIVRDGYNATVDNPSADLYTHLIRRFPRAKVVLTVRDSPQTFETSWKTLWHSVEISERPFTWSFPSPLQWISLFRDIKVARCYIGTTHLQLPPCELLKQFHRHEDGWLGKQYERHNQHVRKHASSSFLEINVKEPDSFRKLCEFLQEKKVDDDDNMRFPYAKTTSAGGMGLVRLILLFIIYGWIPISLGIVLGGIYYIVGYWQSNTRQQRQDQVKKEN